MTAVETFTDLPQLAAHLRHELENKKYVLLFAYNSTGKTRLSTEFKNLGKAGEMQDTLYFNAFTEDLFSWDNDLDGDADRKLIVNRDSRFFAGLEELEMDNRIRPLLQRYADFDFRIDTDEWVIRFSRTAAGEIIDNIKVSRGEENIFIWCFFLVILELAMDSVEAYQWVKCIYIDDPISSLDENNAIAVASHLAQLLKRQDSQLKTVISSHHSLFFNVLCNELGNAKRYFLGRGRQLSGYVLEETRNTSFFYHVAILRDLYRAAQSGKLYTYHFNILRSVLESTSSFHGFSGFSACISRENNDPDGIVHGRLLNLLSHGNYSLYEPVEMIDANKVYFRKILSDFMNSYQFNPELFTEDEDEHAEAS